MDIPAWVQSLGLMEGEVTKNTDAVNGFVTLMGSLQESLMIMARFSIALQDMGILEKMEEELTIEYKPDEANTG